jgi:DNA-binding MarR family transcriptional regulator
MVRQLAFACAGEMADYLRMAKRAAVQANEQERDILMVLGRIARAASSGMREAGRGAGLGASHFLLLQLLETEGAREAGAIAKDLAFSKSTITAILDTLEERGLIARGRDESDGRKVVVSITGAGSQLLSAIPTSFQANFLARLRNLPDWERALVLTALLRVSEMLGPPA